MFDIGARLATTPSVACPYEHRPPVMHRGTFTRPTDLAGEPRTESEPIRERAKACNLTCSQTC